MGAHEPYRTLADRSPPDLAPPACLDRRGFALQGLDFGLEFADALGEVLDEPLPAMGAHAGAENFPAPPCKLHVIVAGTWPPEAAFAAADADVAPAKVDDLHGGTAIRAGGQSFLPKNALKICARLQPQTTPGMKAPKSICALLMLQPPSPPCEG